MGLCRDEPERCSSWSSCRRRCPRRDWRLRRCIRSSCRRWGGVLAFLVEAPAVEKRHLRVLLGDLEDVGVEVAERRGKDDGGAVELDHALHRLLHVLGLRNVLLFADLNAGQGGDDRRPLRVGLVVAVVALRADVDESSRREGFLGGHRRGDAGGARGGCGGRVALRARGGEHCGEAESQKTDSFHGPHESPAPVSGALPSHDDARGKEL